MLASTPEEEYGELGPVQTCIWKVKKEAFNTTNKLSWDCFLDLQFGILLLCFYMMSSFCTVVVYQQKVNVLPGATGT